MTRAEAIEKAADSANELIRTALKRSVMTDLLNGTNPGKDSKLWGALVDALALPPDPPCIWKEVEDGPDFVWSGECGALWNFNTGGPAENEMIYCPNCGRKVEEEIRDALGEGREG